MNFATLSGVYENSRTLSRVFGNGSNFTERVKRVLDNPTLRAEVLDALENLESHLRVMGFDDVVKVEVKP